MRARSAVRDLQHERSGRVADKARGEAECFIRHETTPESSAVNRVLHDQAHALTGLLYDTLMWTAMTAYW